jgi:N-acyl-D-aspartate/D-glutamate deacylase
MVDMLDLLIRGGLVIDGTGSAGRAGDVAIRDGVVVDPGSDTSASRVVDADGLVVAPGFIDLHTHYDPHVMWDPFVTPSSLHGVTTVVGGNCGFSLAPIDRDAAEYVVPMLARVEGMPLESLRAAFEIDWNSFGEWLDRLDGTTALNVGFLAGHSTIRRVVMGDDAAVREANDVEIAAMVDLLGRSLDGGALGLSSSWGSAHFDHFGTPVPSRWSSAAELIALCQEVARHDGTTLEFIPPGLGTEGFDDATVELLSEMSLAAQRPLNWNLLRVRSGEEERRWRESKLAASDRAAQVGARVVPLMLPEPFRLKVNFLAGTTYTILPGRWPAVMALPVDERRVALADPAVRAQLLADAALIPVQIFTNWPQMTVTSVENPSLASTVGRTVGDLAVSAGVEPFDALLDLVVADDLRTVFDTALVDDDDESWQLRAETLRDGRVVIGGSDAGAHLNTVPSFSYHTAFLAEAVRDRGLLSLEEAIRLITDVPARLYGLRGRGRVAPGGHADLVVFDPARVDPGGCEVRHDLPGGYSRLYGAARGLHHVFVNGSMVLEDGNLTGELPGRVLRSGRDSDTVRTG